MSGRGALRLAASLVVPGLLGCDPGPIPVPDRPDVVFVVIDTWRWDAFGANGSPREGITPNLDALAERGVRFERAFASSPWTASSVGTMFTGRYPTIHGCYGRFRDVGSLRESVPTMSEVLGDAGYRCLAVVNGFFLSPEFGFDRGFDVYDFVPSSNKEIRRAGPTVDEALALLEEERRKGPLFLFLHFFDPHLVYDPPPPWDRRWTKEYKGPFSDLRAMRTGAIDDDPEELAYMRALYDGEVGYVDQELGRFFDALDEVLPGRERLVLVTADHGEEFGEHDGWEHGHAMYRELVQVPLVIVPPASRPVTRRVVDAQVRLLDVLPTVLDVAKIPLPPELPGRPLEPWFGEAPIDEDLLAISEREHLGPPSVSVRDGERALVYYLRDERAELYDQEGDPLETRDLAAAEPERVEGLRTRLLDELERLERAAAATGGEPNEVELSDEQLERMRALGYLGDEGDHEE